MMKEAMFSLVCLAFVALFWSPVTVFSAAPTDCAKNPTSAGCPCDPTKTPDFVPAICEQVQNAKPGDTTSEAAFNETTKNIINFAFYGIGVVAIIMVVVSSIRYITSSGDPERASKATKTLSYSIVGMVLAILAFAIVQFVLGWFN
jgi:hypothetical protein